MKPVRVNDLLLDTLTLEGNPSSRIFVQAPYGVTTGGRELVKTSFWTAATRQGCAGQYRFCQHDDQGPWDSQDNFWQMVNPRDVGSCLVVDRQYAKPGTPFGVRQVQCFSPSANFACQKDGKSISDLVNDDKMTAAQLYEGGKFWTDTVERELVKIKVAGAASQDFATIMSKYSVNFFKKATDNMNALNMLIVEQMKEDAWKSTLLVNEAQDKFWECNELGI
ncbi:Hypothetical predicted protein [Cloeon dipterum]|uniref:Uncharacterized protein n=1 Tax=Cloeon dipterum TaxID=197152 RepID=A0A8S1D6E2_9INSE|nr:Hypothetical predicted protein [Cloeon dipterum]